MHVKKQVRTEHGTTDRFKIGKGICQGCILSSCLFNLYAEYVIRNARMEETQSGIKTSGRNINKLRYADDTILMEESEKELKSLLMKVKEESERAGLQINIQKPKTMASSPITPWKIDRETKRERWLPHFTPTVSTEYLMGLVMKLSSSGGRAQILL